MCGITGIFSKNEILNIEARIEKMNSSIIHRGPDAGSVFIDKGKLALGHRRLSIIDTSEDANQPMHSNNKRWHIVFNGEIYNFKEIKEDLDYTFRTKSDTEVILAAVEKKGIDWFLQKANGMFAIGLYDSLENQIYLIRDRLGIKPLYYFIDDKKLIFSSEIKSILKSGLVKAEFNENAIDEYLANRFIRAPYSFFNNILQIKPGSYKKFDINLTKQNKTFWELPNEFNILEEYDEKEVLRCFDDELTKAIKYRLISDVPLGTYLSGGVDSSLITAIAATAKKERINTYTIGFPELNEFKYSKIIANKYRTLHHELLMQKDDYVNNWNRLIKFKDAPLGVPNEIPLAVMSSKLKEKITVVLSGEGADELMGGYGRIFRSSFDYENSAKVTDFYTYFIEKYEYVPRKMRDQLLTTTHTFRREFDLKIGNEFSNRSNEENIFRFFHNYHVKGLLQRVDMTTMQTSVEARVPFLDHKLIEFVYRKVPYDLKLKWKNLESKLEAMKRNSDSYSEELDIPKYLLREMAYKYLPEEIVERKKVGFPVPLTNWFENLEILANELLPTASWLKKGAVNDLIVSSKRESRSGQILWMFINIELFRKEYFLKEWRW
jgi:asparagine synthase (glutamine-hydrolysing)